MILSLLILVVLVLIFAAGFFVADHAKSELTTGRRFFVMSQHVLMVLLLGLAAYLMKLNVWGVVIFAAVLAMHFILKREAFSVMVLALVFSASFGTALIVSSAIIGLYLMMTAALLTGLSVKEKWSRKELFMKGLSLYFIFVVVAVIGLFIGNYMA